MKSIGLFLWAILFFTCCTSGESIESSSFSQEINETEHFVFVLYDDLNDNIIHAISKKLEDNYSRVLDDLGVSSTSKITVKAWGNETHYLDDMQKDIGTKYPGSTGYVYGKNEVRILYTSNAPQTALHETCHVISMHVNSTIPNNPRWLWEAVALYEAGEFRDPKNIPYLVQGNFPTISELNSDFNSGSRKIYEVGYLLSEFIIEKWGRNGYISLIKSNGNVQSSLGTSTQQFENNWKNFVASKYLSK